LNTIIKNYGFLFLVAGTVVVLDQVTKFIVRTNVLLGEMWSPWPWLTPYARIVHINNSGAAFGMLQGFADIFAILAIVVVVIILIYFPRIPPNEWALRLALGLQLGGALGNLIDRLRYQGHVTDFISVATFPVFNIADASISIGVAILILSVWLTERGKPNSNTAGNSVSEDVTGE
jgi:signal peptidase II